MNTEQQNRFEIMKALERDFPDRLLEDLIEVARYVEGEGIEQDSAAKSAGMSDASPAPRTWMKLEHIPAHVFAATDADGDVIRRVAVGNHLEWKFEAGRYEAIIVDDQFGPFIEVLS